MSGTLLFGLILFDIIEGKKYIGGPAINIGLHMAFYGEEPTLVSCVGADNLGEIAKKLLSDNGASTAYIQTDRQHETGKVNVFVDSNGNPSFEIQKHVAYDFISLTEEQLDELSKAEFDILYFGTVVQRSEVSSETLRTLLKRVPFKQSFFDINLREGHYTKEVIDFSLANTDIFKLNDQEVVELARVFGLEMVDEQQVVDWAFEQYPIKLILVTKGENGVSVYTPDERQDIDGIKVQVKDTVGSGDAFSAGFIMEYVKSGDLLRAAHKGNEMGAYVASKTGAVPEIEA